MFIYQELYKKSREYTDLEALTSDGPDKTDDDDSGGKKGNDGPGSATPVKSANPHTSGSPSTSSESKESAEKYTPKVVQTVQLQHIFLMIHNIQQHYL